MDKEHHPALDVRLRSGKEFHSLFQVKRCLCDVGVSIHLADKEATHARRRLDDERRKAVAQTAAPFARQIANTLLDGDKPAGKGEMTVSALIHAVRPSAYRLRSWQINSHAALMAAISSDASLTCSSGSPFARRMSGW